MSTQLVVDFKSISHAKLWYTNQFGETVRCKPRVPTVHGQPFPNTKLACLPDQPPETWLERAIRLDVLDRWTTHCALQLRNNHSLRFVGNKAKEMYKAYSKHIYGNNNKSS